MIIGGVILLPDFTGVHEKLTVRQAMHIILYLVIFTRTVTMQ